MCLSGSQSRPTEDQEPKTAVQIKGILKKTICEEGGFKGGAKSKSIPTGQTPVQNGQREKITLVTAGEYSPAPRATAPWRQRMRKDDGVSCQRSRRPVSMTEDCLSTPLSTRDKYDFSLYFYHFLSNRTSTPCRWWWMKIFCRLSQVQGRAEEHEQRNGTMYSMPPTQVCVHEGVSLLYISSKEPIVASLA